MFFNLDFWKGNNNENCLELIIVYIDDFLIYFRSLDCIGLNIENKKDWFDYSRRNKKITFLL